MTTTQPPQPDSTAQVSDAGIEAIIERLAVLRDTERQTTSPEEAQLYALLKRARELQQAQVVCPKCKGRRTVDDVDTDDNGGSIGTIEACPECASDDEEEEYVVAMLSKLLAEIAVTLKGPEPALTRWSYHDLPEMVRQLKEATPQSSAQAVGDALRAAARAVVTGKVNPSAGRTRLVMLKDVQALESALTGRGE